MGAERRPFDGVRRLLERARRAGVMTRASWEVGSPEGVVAAGVEGDGDDPGALWDTASLTKPVVTATLLLQEVAAGRLALDQPLGSLVPQVGRRLGGVSLAALATHTSGLASWRPLYLWGPGPEEVLTRLGAAWTPHEGPPPVQYSCLGYVALAAALEAHLGEPLWTLAEGRILDPLGMGASRLWRPGALDGRCCVASERGRVAEAMLLDPEDRRRLPGWWGGWRPPDLVEIRGEVHDGNARFLEGHSGNAGLFSTAADLGRFARALLGRRLPGLTERDHDALFEDWTPWSDEHRSLGWSLAVRPGASSCGGAFSPGSIGHTGFTGTSLWLDPRRDIYVVLLADRLMAGPDLAPLKHLRPAFHWAVVEAL